MPLEQFPKHSTGAAFDHRQARGTQHDDLAFMYHSWGQDAVVGPHCHPWLHDAGWGYGTVALKKSKIDTK